MSDRTREAAIGSAGRRPGSRAAELAPRAAPWLATLGRLLLAAIWAWAAVAKIADPDASVRAVRAYRILPEGLVALVGWGLPFLELGLAVLLAAGLATRFAAAASAVLLVAFMAGIVSAWSRGLQIDCGCFGGGGDDPTAGTGTYLRDLARDAALAALACALTAWPSSRLALDARLIGAGHAPHPEPRAPQLEAPRDERPVAPSPEHAPAAPPAVPHRSPGPQAPPSEER